MPVSPVKIGVLTCNVSKGWGLVFGSSRDLDCTFAATSNNSEDYVGKITKFGVDIGYQKGGVMAWVVFGPAVLAPGSLAGEYGGTGSMAGVGPGSNALVGGQNKSVSLQPVAVEGETGLNLAGGVVSIDLKYKR